MNKPHPNSKTIIGLLKAADLTRKRRSVVAWEEVLGGRESPSARLSAVLRGLGPLFSAFTDYLAVRADLIPLADCIEFGNRRAGDQLTPQSAVRELLRSEFSEDNHSRIRTLERPGCANPMFQWHRATIDDGKTVTMKILRPEFEQQLQREQQALRSLERARVGLGDGTELDVATALTDFDAFVQRRINLDLEKNALAHMADAVGVFDCFVVPDACLELCTRRVVTTVAPASERRLAPGAIGFTADPANFEYDTQGEKPDVDLARRLALLWLQQALLTSVYPEGPFEGDMVILGDGKLGVSGGSFGRLDPDCRRSLLQYLTAVAKDEPIRACDLLLDHCDADKAASKRETMQIQFRQAEPFRSGGWSDHYKGRRLADSLFVQWRLARQGGYRPKPHLEAFMRGLFAVEGQARRIATDSDGLREGLNDLRVIAAITRIREHLGPAQFEENMHQFIEAGSTIMRKLAEGPVTQDRTSIAKTAPKRYSAMWIAVSGLSLMLVSLALILERLTAVLANPLMSEKIAAIIFIAVTLGTIWYLRPAKDEE